MIIIPVNTDAPIYHWPWMTLLLVAVNCVTFFVTGFGDESDGWLLRFGHGLNPVEWLAYNFLHAGWLHLIGNMIFVWGFGIVVEGKLGWWRFLLVYLSIGVLGGVLIQTIMLGHDPSLNSGGQGASLIVYGLLAICVVWAPKNEMDVLIFLGYRVLSVEVTILTFGFWYVLLQVLSAWWNHFSMGSAMGHLIGAFWGFGIGISLLKLHWVDCENWDLFAIWSGNYRKPADFNAWKDNIVVTHSPELRDDETPAAEAVKAKKATFRPSIYISSRPKRQKPAVRETASAPSIDAKQPVAAAETQSKSVTSLPASTPRTLDRMRELIRTGTPQAALAEYRKRQRIVDRWSLDADDLQALADGLVKLKLWDETTPLLEEFIERFPTQADAARIKLAAICCEIQNRPLAALKLLDQVNLDALPASIQGHVVQIRQKADRLLDEETFELDGKR